MSTALQITKDLKQIVAEVSGQVAPLVFNDKRKSFQRRYKFVGIYGLTPAQVHNIEWRMSKLYPDERFEVINTDRVKKTRNGNSYYGGLNGLKVKVL